MFQHDLNSLSPNIFTKCVRMHRSYVDPKMKQKNTQSNEMNQFPKKGKTITAKNVHLHYGSKNHIRSNTSGFAVPANWLSTFQPSFCFIPFYSLSSWKYENKIDRDVDGYMHVCVCLSLYMVFIICMQVIKKLYGLVSINKLAARKRNWKWLQRIISNHTKHIMCFFYLKRGKKRNIITLWHDWISVPYVWTQRSVETNGKRWTNKQTNEWTNKLTKETSTQHTKTYCAYAPLYKIPSLCNPSSIEFKLLNWKYWTTTTTMTIGSVAGIHILYVWWRQSLQRRKNCVSSSKLVSL